MSNNKQSGFALLYATVLVTAVSLAIVSSIAFLSLSERRIVRQNQESSQALFAAESGLEDAVYRIKNLLPYSPAYTLQVGLSSADVAVTTEGTIRTVESSGSEKSNTRKLELILDISTENVSFFYGVQVGTQGLNMGNGSTVSGNVFSNGDVVGNGANQSTIVGTAQAAGSSSIEDVKVQGDAYADRLEDCDITGTAYYFTSMNDCSVGSSQQLGEQVQPQSFPITQVQIDVWKAEAEAGGTQGTTSYGNNAQVNLGPKKINGSFSIGNFGTITLGGTVWITGAMSMGNSLTIQLDPSYGGTSGVLILDGPVSFGNGVIARGSGQAESKLMVLSLYGSGTAITLGNTGNGDIFYAPNGIIAIGNGFVAEEITANGIVVGNNATLTYEQGLANIKFSSGPGAGFDVTSWKEKE